MGPGEAIIWIVIILVILYLIIHFWLFWDIRTPRPDHKIKKKNKAVTETTRGESKNGYYDLENGNGILDPVTCNSIESSYFDNRCKCRVPFFGPNCDEEAFSDNYYDIGIGASAGNMTFTNRLSFPFLADPNTPFSIGNQTCTSRCDSDTNCVGVYYETGETMGIKTADSVCGTLSASDITNKTFSMGDKQGNFFLKKPQVPIFTGVGYAFVNNLPKRYWIQNEKISSLNSVPKLLQIKKNGLNSLPNYLYSLESGKFVFAENLSSVSANPGPGARVIPYDKSLKIYPVQLQNTNWRVVYGAFYPASS